MVLKINEVWNFPMACLPFYETWNFYSFQNLIGILQMISTVLNIFFAALQSALPQVVNISLHKKWSFPLRISSVNMAKSASSDLVTFTEEIFNGKLRFFVQCLNNNLIKIFINFKKSLIWFRALYYLDNSIFAKN